MGNCVGNVLSYDRLKEKVRVVTYNGETLGFRSQTKVKKIVSSGAYKGYNLVHQSQPFSPLSPNTKLERGEVYYLVPADQLTRLLLLISPKVVDYNQNDNGSSCKRQKIKIVVTRKQLEFLLKSTSTSSKQSSLESKDVCVSEFEGSSPKWRPSLASIAEAKEYFCETG